MYGEAYTDWKEEQEARAEQERAARETLHRNAVALYERFQRIEWPVIRMEATKGGMHGHL